MGVSYERGTPVEGLHESRSRNSAGKRDQSRTKADLTESVHKVVLHESIPVLIRQLILHIKK